MTDKKGEPAKPNEPETQIQRAPSVVMPSIPFDQLKDQKEKMDGYIDSFLVSGTHFGVPKAMQKSNGKGPKPFLYKSGAEKIPLACECTVVPRLIDSQVDLERKNQYYDKWNDTWKVSIGFYRYVFEADIVHRGTGEVVGTGVGLCSTLESKYISRPHDCDNTAYKMGKKRAMVDAVLTTFGLSDRFSQDEDTIPKTENPPKAKAAAAKPKAEPKKETAKPKTTFKENPGLLSPDTFDIAIKKDGTKLLKVLVGELLTPVFLKKAGLKPQGKTGIWWGAHSPALEKALKERAELGKYPEPQKEEGPPLQEEEDIPF